MELATVEQALETLKAGKPVLVVDHRNRSVCLARVDFLDGQAHLRIYLCTDG
jgi:hypothetical protein